MTMRFLTTVFFLLAICRPMLAHTESIDLLNPPHLAGGGGVTPAGATEATQEAVVFDAATFYGPAAPEYYEHLRLRLARENEKLREHRRAFQTSHVLSVIVAVTVHVMMLVALAIALLEFILAARSVSGSLGTHSASVGSAGPAVKSASMGLAILVVSFSFYALFLLVVYPVAAVQ